MGGEKGINIYRKKTKYVIGTSRFFFGTLARATFGNPALCWLYVHVTCPKYICERVYVPAWRLLPHTEKVCHPESLIGSTETRRRVQSNPYISRSTENVNEYVGPASGNVPSATTISFMFPWLLIGQRTNLILCQIQRIEAHKTFIADIVSNTTR